MNATEIQKTVIDFLMAPYEKIFKGHPSNKLVRGHLESLTVKQFDELMELAEAGQWHIPFYSPNLSENEATKTQFLNLLDHLKIPLKEHIILVDPETGEEIKTPLQYMVLYMPVRRQVQHLIKKMSLADDNKSVDHLTGQVTGDSKSSSVSMPELLALEGRGFNKGLLELIKVRAGDDVAYREMLKQIDSTGGFNVGTLEELGSKPKVVETLAAYLFAMNFDNNLAKD